MRCLALFCIVASLIACGPPPYVRSDELSNHAKLLAPTNADGDTVWLLVVDGLRADALAQYLQTLRAQAYEPRWPSGLAQLQRQNKRLVQAKNAASPLETGRGAVATILTGQRAHQHGVPASAWIGGLYDAQPKRIRHSAKADINRGRTGPLVWATDDAFGVENGFHSDLQTVFSALQTVRSASIFLPFNQNDHSLSIFPRAREHFAAWMDDGKAEHTAPLVDRAARTAAVDLIQSKNPPNLLGVDFRGMHGAYDQQTALKKIDAHLAQMVAALQRAHPERHEKLHVILVGTNPTTPLTETARFISGDDVRARLTELAPACAGHFEPSSLTVVDDDRTARLYVPGTQAAHDCLTGALSRAHLHATGWLDGAAWRKAGVPQVMLSSLLESEIGASRSARLRDRLETAAGGRLGDAVLFAAPNLTFSRRSREAKGGLRAAALDMPLLIASAAWTDVAADAFVSAPIEATGIAPTVVALMGGASAKNEVRFKPARSPLFEWRDGRLMFAPDARLEIDDVERTVKWQSAPAFIRPQVGPLPSECNTPQITIEHPEKLSVARLYWDSRYRVSERRNRRVSTSLFGVHNGTDHEPRKPVQLSDTKSAYPISWHAAGRLLDQLRKRGPLGHKRPRGPLLERFGDTPARRSPSLAFLSLIACDAYQRCHSQPLISDRDFDALMKRCGK